MSFSLHRKYQAYEGKASTPRQSDFTEKGRRRASRFPPLLNSTTLSCRVPCDCFDYVYQFRHTRLLAAMLSQTIRIAFIISSCSFWGRVINLIPFSLVSLFSRRELLTVICMVQSTSACLGSLWILSTPGSAAC